MKYRINIAVYFEMEAADIEQAELFAEATAKQLEVDKATFNSSFTAQVDEVSYA